MSANLPLFDDVVAAHERIRPFVHRTPVLTSTGLNDMFGSSLFFKCENFRRSVLSSSGAPPMQYLPCLKRLHGKGSARILPGTMQLPYL